MRLLAQLSLLAVVISGCNPKSAGGTKAVPAGVPPGQTTDTVATTDTTSDTDTSTSTEKKDQDSAQIAVIGTLGISLDSGSQIIALGVDGSVVNGEVKSDGSFSVPLATDNSYSVLVVPGTLIANAGLALSGDDEPITRIQLDAFGLDNVPTQVAKSDLNLGALKMAADGKGLTPDTGFDATKFLAALGTTSDEAKFAGANDDTSSVYTNLDADGDGVLDYTQHRRTHLSIAYTWGKEPGLVTNPVTLVTATQDFVDLAQIIKVDNLRFTSFDWKIEWHEDLPNHADLTFPAMNVCGPGDPATACHDGATTLAVEGQAGSNGTTKSDMIPAGKGQNGIPAAQFNFFLKDAANGAPQNVLVAGDYSIDFGTYGKFTYKNVRPRVITSPAGLAFISVKFNVDGSGKVTGVDYKWQRAELADATKPDGAVNFVAPSLTDLALLFKGASFSSSAFVCKDSNFHDVAGCNIPSDKLAGSLTSKDCSQPGMDIIGKTLASLGSCMISTRDAYETNISYELWQQP